MSGLVAISVVFAGLALMFLLRTVHFARRRRLFRAGTSSAGCVISALVAGAGAMLLLSYLSYERLTEEQHIASIEFKRAASGEFDALLMIEGSADRHFLLRGDEWQMDARIVTWKPPLTVLGLEPMYRLDRLSGRHTAISREQAEPRTVYSLSTATPSDLWNFARRFPLLSPGIDAHYGTATFVPMADRARFDVSLSRDAIIARPANDSARSALGEWQEKR